MLLRARLELSTIILTGGTFRRGTAIIIGLYGATESGGIIVNGDGSGGAMIGCTGNYGQSEGFGMGESLFRSRGQKYLVFFVVVSCSQCVYSVSCIILINMDSQT